MRWGWVPLPAPQFPVLRNFFGEARRAPASTSTATALLRSLRAPVIPPRRTSQLLATALALVALALRLMLPLLHDPRAHAAIGDRDGGFASACACVETHSGTPWWQANGDATGDRDERERERERGDDHITARATAGHCLACAEAHLPPAPPPPPFDVLQLAAAPTPTTTAPRAPPRAAPERSQHHSRAPPHARA